MKNKLWMGIGAAVILAATISTANAVAWTDVGDWFGERFAYDPGGGAIFADTELSLDLFGSIYNDDLRNTAVGKHLDGQLGTGIGLNYFVMRHWGISLDTAVSGNGNSFFDYLAGSLIYRYPIDEIRLAPYAFAGLTGQFDLNEGIAGHFGFGAEFRLNPLMGVFVDSRYVIPDGVNNYWLIRIGMRLVF